MPVSHWLVDNRLSLQLGRTESIVFGSKLKLRSQSSVNITCNGTPISSISSVKYLVVTIDQHRSLNSMAESFISKGNARLKVLYREKNYLTQHTKKLLVTLLVICHFVCSVWYNGLTRSLK